MVRPVWAQVVSPECKLGDYKMNNKFSAVGTTDLNLSPILGLII